MTTLGIVLSIVSATIFIWAIVSAFFTASENEYLNDQLVVNKLVAEKEIEKLRSKLAQLHIDLDFARSEVCKERMIADAFESRDYFKDLYYKQKKELDTLQNDMNLIIRNPRSVDLLNKAFNN